MLCTLCNRVTGTFPTTRYNMLDIYCEVRWGRSTALLRGSPIFFVLVKSITSGVVVIKPLGIILLTELHPTTRTIPCYTIRYHTIPFRTILYHNIISGSQSPAIALLSSNCVTYSHCRKTPFTHSLRKDNGSPSSRPLTLFPTSLALFVWHTVPMWLWTDRFSACAFLHLKANWLFLVRVRYLRGMKLKVKRDDPSIRKFYFSTVRATAIFYVTFN